MSKREMILRNVAQWKRDQARKAHQKDPDFPPDRSHVKRAKLVSLAVEDWCIEQKIMWSDVKRGMVGLRHRPFVFGDD